MIEQLYSWKQELKEVKGCNFLGTKLIILVLCANGTPKIAKCYRNLHLVWNFHVQKTLSQSALSIHYWPTPTYSHRYATQEWRSIKQWCKTFPNIKRHLTRPGARLVTCSKFHT